MDTTNSNPTPSSTTPTATTAAQPEALQPLEFQASYKRAIARALAVPAREIMPLTSDVQAILRNVRIGVAAVLQRMDEVRQLPVESSGFAELPELAEALYLATRLVVEPVSTQEVTERFNRVRPLRKEMLATARGFARRGLVPAERVAAIASGNGNIDTANDAIELAALYVEFQVAIGGKHMFTRAEIESMAVDGAWLVRTLTKEGLRPQVPLVQGVSQREIRDRLHTLVQAGHKSLRRVATFLWQDQVDQHVPKLLSRSTSRPTGGPAAPAPVPTPSGTTDATPIVA